MRAAYYDRFGGPEVLQIGDLPDPVLAPDRVLVRIHAAGINPADHKMRSGTGNGFPHRFPIVAGMDLMGVVLEIGEKVDRSDLAAGVRVAAYVGTPFLDTGGTWATMISVPATSCAVVPPGAGNHAAAALPCAGLTALQLADELEVGAADTVVAHGGAGGVGHLFVQIARARGARVIATASAANHPFLQRLGVEPVDYTADVFGTISKLAPSGVTVVADLHGGDLIRRSRTVLAESGRTGSIAASSDVEVDVRVRVRPSAADLTRLLAMIADETVRIEIDDVVPFDDVITALARVETGHARGKIVIDMGAT